MDHLTTEERVVLITGVAGGIGRATARVFHEAGWHVVGVDRDIKSVPGGSVPGVETLIEADIAEADAFDSIFAELHKSAGRLDALVNNAALQICKPVMDTTVEEWDAVMASNLRSVFLAVKLAHPMLKERAGSIVNISSVHAMATSKNLVAYAASKGALSALTRSMALEFGGDGVRVNAVAPGAIDTQMLHAGLNRGHLDDVSKSGGSAGDAATLEDKLRGLGGKHPLGRVGQPEEVGRMIHFLADGTRSSFVTGQTLVCDGGALARLSTE